MAAGIQGHGDLSAAHPPAFAKAWEHGRQSGVHEALAEAPGSLDRTQPAHRGEPTAAVLRLDPPGHVAGRPQRAGHVAQPPGGPHVGEFRHPGAVPLRLAGLRADALLPPKTELGR